MEPTFLIKEFLPYQISVGYILHILNFTLAPNFITQTPLPEIFCSGYTKSSEQSANSGGRQVAKLPRSNNLRFLPLGAKSSPCTNPHQHIQNLNPSTCTKSSKQNANSGGRQVAKLPRSSNIRLLPLDAKSFLCTIPVGTDTI